MGVACRNYRRLAACLIDRLANELALYIPAGQFVAVVGRSGGGKSTLLRLLAGLEQPNGGSLLAGNAPLRGSQDARLLPWKSVIDNAWLESRAKEWPAALSGGQKQRVAQAGFGQTGRARIAGY